MSLSLAVMYTHLIRIILIALLCIYTDLIRNVGSGPAPDYFFLSIHIELLDKNFKSISKLSRVKEVELDFRQYMIIFLNVNATQTIVFIMLLYHYYYLLSITINIRTKFRHIYCKSVNYMFTFLLTLFTILMANMST